MNKFCAKCLSETPHTPDERLDAGDRKFAYTPDPGETCDFCPEQATAYATKLDTTAFVVGVDVAAGDDETALVLAEAGVKGGDVIEIETPKKRAKK